MLTWHGGYLVHALCSAAAGAAIADHVICPCCLIAAAAAAHAQHGMSIGIGDTVADAATGAKIGAIIDAAKEDVQRIIEQYQVRHKAPDKGVLVQCPSYCGVNTIVTYQGMHCMFFRQA